MIRGWLLGAVILAAWFGALSTRPEGLFEGVPPLLHHFVASASAGITAALVPRRKILAGASLAIIPALFVAIVTARSKPDVMMMVPKGPRAAPFYAVAELGIAAVPCTAGAALGALLTRRRRDPAA